MRVALFFLCMLPIFVQAQNKDFDNLEILYDQGHYKKVLRKATKLISKPGNEQAILPSYYRSMALLQLYRNDKWRKRNSKAIEECVRLFLETKKRDVDGRVFAAHIYEIQSLKRDYDYFIAELEQNTKKNTKLIADVRAAYNQLFTDVQDIRDVQQSVVVPPMQADLLDVRKRLVEFAYKYVGVKYRSGGTDPNGFDCSGFVTFVFKQFEIEVPRISRDQQKKSSPLKVGDVQPGDLVFFANGANVNHVGIVVQNKNGIVTMVHSSTSQGIVITEINTSTYWNNRVHSYGTFLK